MKDRTSEIFGEVIFSYTRAQAIADGVLVDLCGHTEAGQEYDTAALVREAGFKYPIAMTVGAFSAAIGDPDRATPLPPGQDLKGRAWDVLMMLKFAIARSGSTDRVHFTVKVSGRNVRLWSQCGPGDKAEPVITIMLEGED